MRRDSIPQVCVHAETAPDSTTSQAPVADHYRSIERAIEKMQMGFSNLCFVQGRPGIGKSYQIELCLKKLKVPYVEVNGATSDAYLYRLLQENNGKTIWFKDVARLLKGLRSIDLLKSACETRKKRLITNLNYSDKQRDLPKQFYFTGKIIFDFNSLTGLKLREDFEALASRGDYIDLVFSFDDICEIMRGICKTDQERELTEFLIEHHEFCGFNALNLRTQRLAFMTAEYAKKKGLAWQDEVSQELKSQRSAAYKLLYPVLGNGRKRTSEIKRHLVRAGVVQTLRTADRRISDWLEMGDIYRASTEQRNFLVSLQPFPIGRG